MYHPNNHSPFKGNRRGAYTLLLSMICLFHISSLWGMEMEASVADSIHRVRTEHSGDIDTTVPDWSLIFADYDDEEEWQEVQEVLTTMAMNRQNINEATMDDLRMVPLLSEEQAAAILHYRQLYGDLRSMAELSLITAIDHPRQQMLSALFYALPTISNGHDAIITPSDSISQISRQRWHRTNDTNRGRMLLTMSVPTYERQGQRDGSYQGSALSHTLRLSYGGRNYQLALTAAQDAGEPFFTGANAKGWDFYTGYVRMKNLGMISNLVAGHYQLQLGMGLLLNNNWRLSRTAMLLSQPSAATILRGHSSRQENNYLQGVAATLAWPLQNIGGKITMTAFASYRGLDATMSDTMPATVTTILTTGYHRTESEINRRNATTQAVAGMSLGYSHAPLMLSLNMIYVTMGDSLLTNKAQRYRTFYPTGKHFASASLAYALTLPRLQLSGETAMSEKAKANEGEHSGIAMATLNSIRWKMNSEWTAFAVQRFYSYRFVSLLGKSFGDVSNVQDESGVYVGTTTTAIKHLSLSAYVDCAYHPWFRYGWDGSSRSWDTYLMATFSHRNVSATLRYRYREQALSTDGMAWPAYGGSFDGTGQHLLRGTIKMVKGRWTTMTQVHGTYLPTSTDSGWLLSQAIGYSKRGLSAWLSATYFNTSAYASRLYLTDRSLTYGSLTTMLYGHGIRMNIMGQADITKHIAIALRCVMLHYSDRNYIGSSHQMINGNNQTDIQAQLAWKF